MDNEESSSPNPSEVAEDVFYVLIMAGPNDEPGPLASGINSSLDGDKETNDQENPAPQEQAGMMDAHVMPYMCSVCGKQFKYRTSVKNHEKAHFGDRPFKCPVCPKKFSRRSSVVVHARTHTGERPYQCAVCGKAFRQSSHLKDHKLIHTGEKPYKCTVCGEAMRYKQLFRKHMRIHHSAQ